MILINKAKELLQPITFEPHEVAYFVTLNGFDMGNEDYCENCINEEVKKARAFHKEERQRIIDKYNKLEKNNKYPIDEIKKSKRVELKDYPAKASFGYEGHDPDFGGGNIRALTCEGCGEYFQTNFEPDVEECNCLLDEYKYDIKKESKCSEELKWKLDVAFYNYEHLDKDAKKVLLKIAKKIIKQFK